VSLNTKTRQASLELTFSLQDGQTVLSHQRVTSPLKIWRPFEVGGGRVLVQIINVSPGIMAGDDYRLELTIQTGAKVVVVNQSATKLHTMPEGLSAKQNVLINVEDGGELEYYPGLTIPFPDADYMQNILVNLAKTAKFAMLERYAAGRVGRGETFEFRKVSSRVRVMRDGAPVYADGLELKKGIGLLDGHVYLASGIICWDEPLHENVQTQRLMIVAGQAVRGVSYLRALSQDGLELIAYLDNIVKRWREERGLEEIVFSRFSS
jgi:urease accessory protein